MLANRSQEQQKNKQLDPKSQKRKEKKRMQPKENIEKFHTAIAFPN